ncbi:PAS domain-containing sensor histidine kinase [Croceiramulus getboli]|nr:PAS domain S-box protein [Flavobacteriaceae bacterium YJPT1-3]
MDHFEHSLHHTLINQSPNIIAIFDREMNYIGASKKWKEHIGFPIDEELTGRNHYEVAPDLREDWKEVHRRSLEGEIIAKEEDWFISDQGKKLFISWHCNPWRKTDGEIGGIILHIQDITQRKKEQDFLRQTTEIAQVGAWEVNPIAKTIRWSDQLKVIHGLRPEEDTPALEEAINFFPEGENRDRIKAAFGACMESGIPYDIELQLCTRQGAWKWVRAKGEAEFDQGECVRVFGILQDIDQRKRRELRIQISESKNRALFENAYIAIFITNEQGEITEANNRMLQISGYGQEELIHSNPRLFVDDKAYRKNKKALEREKFSRAQLTGIRKDGAEFPAQVSSSRFTDGYGNEFNCFVVLDISQRIEAQSKLEEANNFLKTLIDHLPVNIFVKDHKFRKTLVNKAEYEYLGAKNAEEILGKTDKELFPEKSATISNEEDREVLEEGKTIINRETINYLRDGSTNYFLTSKLPIKNAKGEITSLLGISVDINALKEIETKLEEERRFLRTLLDNIPINVYVKDTEGRKILANKAEYEFLGASSEEEVLHKKDDAFLVGDSVTNAGLDDEQVLKQGRSIKNKVVGSHTAKGRKGYLLISKIPLYDNNQEINGLLGISYDITEQRMAETKLQVSEHKFRTLFELAPVSFVMCDLHIGSIRDFNNSFVSLLQTQPDQLFKHTIWDFDSSREFNEQTVKTSLKETSFYGPAQHTFTRMDGTSLPVIINGVATADETDQPVLWLVIQDITEIKEKEDKLEQLLKLSEKQRERLMSFAYIVTHNLRAHSNNLTMITSLFGLETDTQEVDKLHQMTTSTVTNLSRTIDELSEIIAVTEYKELKLKEVGLKQALEQQMEIIDKIIEDNEACIQMDVSETFTVKVVPAYLDSIIINVMTNAIKYRDPNRQVRLDIKARYVDGMAHISFHDNGIGIDLEEHGAKLFSLYGKLEDREDSTGIGLYLIKNQVETMGGSIQLESTPGEGTTVHVRLPK